MNSSTSISIADLKKTLNWTVIVAALGYFVDMFDITLFGVVRVESLKGIGISDPQDILKIGIQLYNYQMIGMMIGGVLWGVLADKKGRTQVLFGSILLYSLGNLANAFVTDVTSYSICRFITGVGLAGELGAAITLVAESLPVNLRGLGTTIVATMGLLGSVVAAYLGQHMSWKTAYIAGGLMGCALLLTRFKMQSSNLFDKMKEQGQVERGNIFLLFSSQRIFKYLRSILIGTPIYFITGIIFTFSPEILKGLGYQEAFTASEALLYGTIGLTFGDLLSGLISQKIKSRKKSIVLFLTVALLLCLSFLIYPHQNKTSILLICFGLGICAGYWAVLITIAAEQFGTNLRGTVASTVPNFVRGSAVIGTSLFLYLKQNLELSVFNSVLILGGIWFSLAFLSLWKTQETFFADLNYIEEK